MSHEVQQSTEYLKFYSVAFVSKLVWIWNCFNWPVAIPKKNGEWTVPFTQFFIKSKKATKENVRNPICERLLCKEIRRRDQCIGQCFNLFYLLIAQCSYSSNPNLLFRLYTLCKCFLKLSNLIFTQYMRHETSWLVSTLKPIFIANFDHVIIIINVKSGMLSSFY